MASDMEAVIGRQTMATVVLRSLLRLESYHLSCERRDGAPPGRFYALNPLSFLRFVAT